MADAMLAGGNTTVVVHLTVAEACALHEAASAVLSNPSAASALFRSSGPTIDAGKRAQNALRAVLNQWEVEYQQDLMRKVNV